MKLIYIICVFFLVPSITNAQEIFTESQLFANFKDENSCWYNMEVKMVEESEKIINFQKKFSLELKSNTPEFWQEVNDKVRILFSEFDFSACNGEGVTADPESELANVRANIWEQNNPWFGEDDDMTSFAIEMHTELVENGIDSDSETYYNSIDEKMRIQFPDYFYEDNQLSSDEDNNTVDDEEYTLSIDGNDLIFVGTIEKDLYYDFKNILKNNPTVNRLILKSTGGLEAEALDIADIIIDFELDTHAFDCNSSCTILFIAGEKRTLQRGYKMGFHRTYWSADSLEAYYDYYKDFYNSVFDFTSWVYDDTQDTLFKKFQYLIERGVEPLFIIKTLRAKSDGMWYPRRKELLNANFITE